MHSINKRGHKKGEAKMACSLREERRIKLAEKMYEAGSTRQKANRETKEIITRGD